jgi:Spy/CpxP family protein refolding chaperone
MSRRLYSLLALNLFTLVLLIGYPVAGAVELVAAASRSLESCDEQPAQGSGKPRSHKWWRSAEGRAAFGITDQQSRDLEAIFQSMLPTLRTHKAEVDRHQQALSKLLSEASANETVVIQHIDRLEAAQSALSRTRTLMLYRMYRLLTPEQRALVQAQYERDHNSETTRR